MVDNQHLHQIGEVAERVGLSLRTVRYYEEQGLVSPAQRTDGGFRLYGDREISRLALIKQMKPLDLSVQQMRELLDARDGLETADPDGDDHAAALERLAHFCALANERVERQRAELVLAERFARTLSEELHSQQRRSGAAEPS